MECITRLIIAPNAHINYESSDVTFTWFLRYGFLKLRSSRADIAPACSMYAGAYCPVSGDFNDVACSVASELLADVGPLRARGSTHASRFVARAEIVRTGESD